MDYLLPYSVYPARQASNAQKLYLDRNAASHLQVSSSLQWKILLDCLLKTLKEQSYEEWNKDTYMDALKGGCFLFHGIGCTNFIRLSCQDSLYSDEPNMYGTAQEGR